MNHPLASRLQGLVAELSGKNPQELDPQLTFFELGLDSLFLTQLSRELSKVFGVKLAFRQLAERWPTIEALARHLADRVPLAQDTAEDTQPSKAPSSAAAISESSTIMPFEEVAEQAGPGTAVPADGSLYALFTQQLELMSHQLAMLAGSAATQESALEPAKSVNGHASAATKAADIEVVTPLDAAISRRPLEANALGSEARAAATPNRPVMKPGQWLAGSVPLAQGGATRDGRPVHVRQWSDLDQHQQRALRAFIDEYNAKTLRSKTAVQSRRRALADPRTIAGFNPVWKDLCHPLVVSRSSGSRLWDVDGNEYVDLLNGFGANLLGHNHPLVVQAIQQQLEQNADVGPLSPLAGETAELLCELTGMERASFLCTGSEAVQAALRCARTHTGRDKIVVFENADHGNFDEVLVRAESNGRGDRAWPSVPGVPSRAVADVVVLPYAQLQSLDALRVIGNQVAAVLVEPVQSRKPELQPREFLQRLRGLTREVGALLIFDEVVTGFRCHPGGAQAYFDVRADLAVYGKVCGGGMPIGVVAGSARVMDTFDGGYFRYGDESRPLANVSFFAGTFVRHPLALAASRAVLQYLKQRGPGLQRELAERTAQLVSRLNGLFEDFRVPLQLSHFTSLMYLRDQGESELSSLLWPHLGYYGVHVQRGFPSYLTLAHDERDLSRVVNAFRDSLEAMARCGFHPRTARHQSGMRTRRVPTKPPVAGARLGKDAEGRPAWFVADPSQPNRYVQVS